MRPAYPLARPPMWFPVWLACDAGVGVIGFPSRPPLWNAEISVEDLAGEAGFQDYSWHKAFKRGRSCSVRDFDADGLLDVFIGNPYDTSYVLRGGGVPGAPTFSAAPPILEGEFPWSAPSADYDQDGDVDLFLAMGGIESPAFDKLLRNDGVLAGTTLWTDVTDEAGIAGPVSAASGEVLPAMSVGAQWLDVDQDGDLDLHVDTGVFPSLLAGLADDATVARSLLWRNDGGSFTEIAASVGLTLVGLGRYSSWLDFDLDGDLDLYQNHFRSAPQTLWRNDLVETGVLGFQDVTAAMSLGADTDLAMPPEVFASATADVNGDGWPDLISFVRGVPEEGPYGEGHVIHINVDGKGFVGVQELAGIDIGAPPSPLRNHEDPGVMGCQVVDTTGDGLPDLYVGNGGPSSGNRDQWFIATDLVDVAFEGVGTVAVPVYDERSDLVDFAAPVAEAPAELYPPYPYRTHGTCAADIDRDGVAEMMVINGGMFLVGGDAAKEPNRLFRVAATPAARFLRVHLLGDPYGARVTVRATDVGGNAFQTTRFLWSREGFGASNGEELWMGLRDAARIDSVEIRWPDGAVHDLGSVPLDGDLVVEPFAGSGR